MRTITLKTTAPSGGHAFAVDDSRSGGVRADLPLGPSGDGHALFYRVTGVPLAEVMRRFNGAALRRVWEVPVRSARPRRRVTAGAFRAGRNCRRTGAQRQPRVWSVRFDGPLHRRRRRPPRRDAANASRGADFHHRPGDTAMAASQAGSLLKARNVPFDPADWLARFEALGHVTYLWIGMNGNGLSLFRTLSGGDGHRALVHELCGNPATAAARERGLIEHMKATCRYGNPGWRAARLEEGWTPVDFEAFLDDERRRWHGREAQRREV